MKFETKKKKNESNEGEKKNIVTKRKVKELLDLKEFGTCAFYVEKDNIYQ